MCGGSFLPKSQKVEIRLGRKPSLVEGSALEHGDLVAQGDKLKPEIMSRPEERSKPTEETQEEPEYEGSLHDWVGMIGEEAGGVDKLLILGAD